MENNVRIIVGLGNPGMTYAHTRHNIGFDIVDAFAKKHKVKFSGRSGNALVGKYERLGNEILFVKPMTFMNNSGNCVGSIARKHNANPSELLVIYDDVDLPLGKMRIKPSGSSGGHNGMKSIIEKLGSKEFPRMRIGIDKSSFTVDHVLTRFNRQQRKIIDATIADAVNALEDIIDDGLDKAMNLYNTNDA
jgi:PTH1 family peptidyl-tRNA hydrolase